MLSELFEHIDFNSILIGFFTLFTTFGFKYIHADLDDEIEAILDSEWMRKFYIFSFIYLATKNMAVSLILTIVYILSVWFGKKDKAYKQTNHANN